MISFFFKRKCQSTLPPQQKFLQRFPQGVKHKRKKEKTKHMHFLFSIQSELKFHQIMFNCFFKRKCQSTLHPQQKFLQRFPLRKKYQRKKKQQRNYFNFLIMSELRFHRSMFNCFFKRKCQSTLPPQQKFLQRFPKGVKHKRKKQKQSACISFFNTVRA